MSEEKEFREDFLEKNVGDEEDYESPKSKKGGVIKEVIHLIIYILFIFALTYLIINYVGQRTQVSGSSMETTLHDGDNLIVEKISYRFTEPKRYDVIVFPFHYTAKTYYIKRIIGLPGETVQIDNSGTIYIDGEVLNESFGREVIRNPGLASEKITLADDEYFVLGDNRNYSADSRDPTVANIKRDEIIGRAWVRIFPFDKIGFIEHE